MLVSVLRLTKPYANETSVNISRVVKISAAKQPRCHSAGGSMLVVADGDACFLQDVGLNARL